MSASVLAAAPASAAPPTPTPQSRAAAVAELKASSDRTPTVITDRSGAVTSVRTAPGHPIDRPAGVRRGASAELTARGLAKEHGAAFGLRKGDAELRTTATLPAAGGLEVVRFNQTVGNVPVLGADLVVTVRPDGETVSVGSTVTTATPVSTTPRVTAGQAAATARAATVSNEKLATGTDLTVATPALAMFDPAVFGVPGRPGMRPVWRTKVTGEFRTGPVGADVLVDARSGRVLLYANALHTVKSRQVCDHATSAVPDTSGPGQLCPAGLPIRTAVLKGTVAAVEDNLPAGANTDVKNAYDYAGTTYDFYKTLFDRDSIDGNGMQIRSSVRYCPPNGSGSACYQNAYWDGAQMVYGPGFASADDVVAHELTHGVTEHTANLYYWYQSGAINESMSDVFGEFVDLTDNTDGAGTQTAWDMGEDLPRGALRSLSNPAAYGDPDSMTSTLYAGGSGDYGGVHQNSGVGNHAAYLIATGFGGGAAGISKAAQLYYETLQKLPSGADYADLARTLQTSCTTLLGTTLPALQVDPAVDPATVTVTAADCSVVDSAIAATAMTAQPSTANASAPEAPFCPDGSEPAPALFSDDMEDTTSGKWKLPTPDHPMDAFADYFDATRYGASYASSGKVSLVAASSASENTSASSKVGWIQAADAIPIPTGKQTFLWFAHADLLTDGRNDGVRVSAAVGNVHTDLGGKLDGGTPAVNGYNVTSLTGSAGGAFNGDSHGYVSSRFDLTPFAGKSVKPTFDLVGDGSADSVWWLDDVRVYTCDSAAPSPVKTLTVTPSAPTAATVSWTTPEWAGTSGLRDYSLTVDGVRQTVAPGTTTVSVPDLAATTAHTFSVVANATDGTAGNAAAATAVRTRSTIARSPSTVVYGQRVTVYGDVVRSDTGARVAVPGVLIESRPRGTSTWSRVTTVRTDANGHWVMTYAPGRHSEFRATPQAGTGTPAGLGAWAGSPSAAAGTYVAWRVNAAFASSTIRRGQTAQLKVSVAPGRYVTLELQRRVGSRWVVVQRKTSNSKGVAVLTVRHTSAGAFSYRAVARADAQLLVNGSSNRSLRVR